MVSTQKEAVSASDEDAIADLMEQHEQFLNTTQSHLTKVQVNILVEFATKSYDI